MIANRKNFEYKIVVMRLDEGRTTERDLDSFGLAGWELIAVIPTTQSPYGRLFFKREVGPL